ncbi:MAG TPA: BlaI/MecI/CopY family transcriptional regulator [Vicinamibacterales bacterium]|jgi:predicted transcriptional regulator
MLDSVAPDSPRDWEKIRSTLELDYLPSEVRLLESLWTRSHACCVRDVRPDFPGVSYTTLMTALDRLYKKGALDRQKKSRAFYYVTKASPEQMVAALTEQRVAGLLRGDINDLRPVFSQLVDFIASRDESLLDELEALLRVRRGTLKAASS